MSSLAQVIGVIEGQARRVCYGDGCQEREGRPEEHEGADQRNHLIKNVPDHVVVGSLRTTFHGAKKEEKQEICSRKASTCIKRQSDAIHLATAFLANVANKHTDWRPVRVVERRGHACWRTQLGGHLHSWHRRGRRGPRRPWLRPGVGLGGLGIILDVRARASARPNTCQNAFRVVRSRGVNNFWWQCARDGHGRASWLRSRDRYSGHGRRNARLVLAV
mmetsp:Transcript_81102/g.146384  ORF Transcript_81102/g.146384 Transcript_81102/m.146384 type:complete len:219 (+) Transcript_81102:1077-1733(+)